MDYRECLERLAASGHIEQKNGLKIHVNRYRRQIVPV